jgi:hypothetical protein
MVNRPRCKLRKADAALWSRDRLLQRDFCACRGCPVASIHRVAKSTNPAPSLPFKSRPRRSLSIKEGPETLGGGTPAPIIETLSQVGVTKQ